MPDTQEVTIKVELPVGFEPDHAAFAESPFRCVAAVITLRKFRLRENVTLKDARECMVELEKILAGEHPAPVLAVRTELLTTGVVTADAETDTD